MLLCFSCLLFRFSFSLLRSTRGLNICEFFSEDHNPSKDLIEMCRFHFCILPLFHYRAVWNFWIGSFCDAVLCSYVFVVLPSCGRYDVDASVRTSMLDCSLFSIPNHLHHVSWIFFLHQSITVRAPPCLLDFPPPDFYSS